MKCSSCGKEAIRWNGKAHVICDDGPCIFPGKVTRWVSSDAACGLGPNALVTPSMIYGLALVAAVPVVVVMAVVLLT